MELRTRLTSAEEELASFQEYMKGAVLQYQKEIVKLKRELLAWKSVAQQNGITIATAQPSAAPDSSDAYDASASLPLYVPN